MRLIDADALKNRLVDAVKNGVNLNYDIEARINGEPTVASTYRWIRLESYGIWFYQCPECKRLSDRLDRFCPSCGLKMEVE